MGLRKNQAPAATSLQDLTDEELDAALAAAEAPAEAPDLSSLSDEELDAALAEAEGPGFFDKAVDMAKGAGSAALDGVAAVGEFADRYTGAPMRAAIGTLQDDVSNVKGAAQAFASQFGEEAALAPSGKQIAQKAGVPDTALSDVLPGMYTEDPEEAKDWLKFQKGGLADPTASGAAGLGIDIAADPTNVIPVGAVAKGAAKMGLEAGTEAAKILGKGAQIAGDVVAPATTRAIVETAETFGSKAKQIANAIKPSLRNDWLKSSELAAKHGIDPELLTASVKYGPNSFISKAERVAAQGVQGEQMLQKYEDGIRQIRRASDDVIAKIGDGVAPLSPTDAGDVLRQGYKDAKGSFFDQMDFTYRSSASQLPGGAKTPLSKGAVSQAVESLDKVAAEATRKSKNLALSKGTIQQAKETASKIQMIKSRLRSGKMTYQQGLDLLEDMAQGFKEGVKGANDIPIDTRAMRDAYDAASKALIETVRENLGDDAAKALIDNNKAMSEWFDRTKGLEDVLLDKNVSGEAVFQKLVQRGDTETLKKIREIYGPDSPVLKRAKASFLDSLKSADDFSFDRLAKKLEDPKTDRVFKELFSPDEAQEIRDLVRLGQDMGDPIMNRSGTDVSKVFRSPLESLKDTALNTGLTDYMKRVAESGEWTGKLPPPQIPGSLLPTIGQDIGQAAMKDPGALERYLKDLRPSRGQVYRKSAEVVSIQEREAPVFIPPENREMARTEIMGLPDVSNTEKALLMNELNRSGSVPQRVLDAIQGGPQ